MSVEEKSESLICSFSFHVNSHQIIRSEMFTGVWNCMHQVEEAVGL